MSEQVRRDFRMLGVMGIVALLLALFMVGAPQALAAEAGTGQAASQSASQVSSKYVVKTKDYQFTVPKYWRGKVCWKTEAHQGWQTSVKYYHTHFYLKGHKGDSRYLILGIWATNGGSGPGLDMTGVNAGIAKSGGKTVYVWGHNYPLTSWMKAKSSYGRGYAQDVSKSDLNKMCKIVTGGKVTYKKALKSVKDPSYRGYGDSKTSKYAKSAQKYLQKQFKNLKVK